MIRSRPWSQNSSIPNLLANMQASYPSGRSLCSTPGAGRKYPNVTAWWNGWRIERKYRTRLCRRALCASRHIPLFHVMILRGYQCPYPPFPFPLFPDTGTVSDCLNRTFVVPLAQPLFKQTSRRLTSLHACDLAVHWSQPDAPTRAHALLPHGQQALYFLILIRAPVFLCCLLDCLTCRIPYAEPGDLSAVFPTQQCRTRDTYQIQAVALTEQRSPLGVVHARRLVSYGGRDGDLLSRHQPPDLLAHNRTSSPLMTRGSQRGSRLHYWLPWPSLVPNLRRTGVVASTSCPMYLHPACNHKEGFGASLNCSISYQIVGSRLLG